MTVHKHHGGVVRRSPAPKHQIATNVLHGGSQSVSPQLDQAPNMAVPGGGAMPAGSVGPGTPAPDASTALPQGAPPPGTLPVGR
jgi:hypothetical protein